MKRLTIITLTLILSIGLIGGPTCMAFAGTSISSLVNSYKKALAAENSAKAVYDAAAVDYNKGSLGFYNWVAATQSGWMKEDAEEAVQVLTRSSFKSYTNMGAANDATNLTNMKTAVALLPELAQLRANDSNFRGLAAPTIRNVFMARSQINANASAITFDHMPYDDGYETEDIYECLSWGAEDPFGLWYSAEKRYFDKVRNFYITNYGADITIPEQEERVAKGLGGCDKYEEVLDTYGETGHYLAVVCGAHAASGYGEGLLTNFGLATSLKDPEWQTFCLNADPDSDYYAAYSVSEYTNLFNSYYNQVYPAAEAKAYNKAKAAKDSVLSKLKSAAKPAKPTAKRSKKKVTVKWKKKSSVSGYQISVSPSKGKTKIIATVKGNKTKKTVKISKAKKQYVKVRSYINVSGTTVYSSWSKVKKTK